MNLNTLASIACQRKTARECAGSPCPAAAAACLKRPAREMAFSASPSLPPQLHVVHAIPFMTAHLDTTALLLDLQDRNLVRKGFVSSSGQGLQWPSSNVFEPGRVPASALPSLRSGACCYGSQSSCVIKDIHFLAQFHITTSATCIQFTPVLWWLLVLPLHCNVPHRSYIMHQFHLPNPAMVVSHQPADDM